MKHPLSGVIGVVGLAIAALLVAGTPVLAQSAVVAPPPTTLPSGASTAANQTTANTKLDQLHTDATAATPAGENHIGEVGGKVAAITVAPTVTASSAYTSGNAVGGLLTFANAARVSGGTGLVQAVTINFKSAQTGALDFAWCGASNLPNTTVTDKSAVAVTGADFDKCRVIHISDCTSLGTPSVCSADSLAFPFVLSSGTTGYGFLITRSTPTFSATSDVSVTLRILQN